MFASGTCAFSKGESKKTQNVNSALMRHVAKLVNLSSVDDSKVRKSCIVGGYLDDNNQ